MAKNPVTPLLPAVIEPGPEFSATYKAYGASRPQVITYYVKWIAEKQATPLRSIGNDKPFVGATALKGYMHAKMTRDISLVYKVAGSNPQQLKLYGFFSHKDLGTTTPPSSAIQNKVGARFKKQTFED